MKMCTLVSGMSCLVYVDDVILLCVSLQAIPTSPASAKSAHTSQLRPALMSLKQVFM